MYLEADLEAKQVPNTFEIDRQLLQGENKVFVISNDLLEMVPIIPVYFKENSVVVQGLADGTQILARPVLGAYQGMRVKIIE